MSAVIVYTQPLKSLVFQPFKAEIRTIAFVNICSDLHPFFLLEYKY